MDYEELPRAALIKLLQEHDESLDEAGRDGIVMNYTGRTAPWQIIRHVKLKLSRILKKLPIGEESAQFFEFPIRKATVCLRAIR